MSHKAIGVVLHWIRTLQDALPVEKAAPCARIAGPLLLHVISAASTGSREALSDLALQSTTHT